MAKTYIVTGAGSGIGRAACALLAERDHANIILVGRNKKNLEETRSTLIGGGKHHIVACDITNAKSLRSGLVAVEILKDGASGIIVNAGVGGGNEYGEKDRWHEVINTNLTGAYVTANECLPYLRKQKDVYRNIIFISSILGKMGVPGYTAYCASKTGLLGLTRSLALELAPEKILVNAICPGWVETQMARDGMNAIAIPSGKSFDQVYNEQMSFVPLGKWSEPLEIAALISYLVSENQRSITGQAIDINNGAFMAQ